MKTPGSHDRPETGRGQDSLLLVELDEAGVLELSADRPACLLGCARRERQQGAQRAAAQRALERGQLAAARPPVGDLALVFDKLIEGGMTNKGFLLDVLGHVRIQRDHGFRERRRTRQAGGQGHRRNHQDQHQRVAHHVDDTVQQSGPFQMKRRPPDGWPPEGPAGAALVVRPMIGTAGRNFDTS